MGSLPNLNDLRQEKSQRRATAERERDAARERAQQLEHMQRNQLPTLLQVKHKDPPRKIYENLFDYRHRPSPFLLSHTFPFSFPHQRHFSAESWIKWLVWDSFLECKQYKSSPHECEKIPRNYDNNCNLVCGCGSVLVEVRNSRNIAIIIVGVVTNF